MNEAFEFVESLKEAEIPSEDIPDILKKITEPGTPEAKEDLYFSCGYLNFNDGSKVEIVPKQYEDGVLVLGTMINSRGLKVPCPVLGKLIAVSGNEKIVYEPKSAAYH